jgi:hypothetical protein
MTQRTGHRVATPGSTLAVGDFVRHDGIWYRLDAVEDEVRNRVTGCVYTRRFLGVAKDGSRRRLLLDSRTVVAYRFDRA